MPKGKGKSKNIIDLGFVKLDPSKIKTKITLIAFFVAVIAGLTVAASKVPGIPTQNIFLLFLGVIVALFLLLVLLLFIWTKYPKAIAESVKKFVNLLWKG